MRAVVAMSGGVDSSVTAALLKEQGYDVIGLTMTLQENDEDANACNERTCCSARDVNDARRVCEKLDIPFYPLNFRAAFYERVILPFIDEYLAGRTPNPCLQCNTDLKFNLLLERARALDADILATGHYAQLVENQAQGTFHLRRGVDKRKDQSYFLYGLSYPATTQVRFPLGGYTKNEVRDLARHYGLQNAEKRESQDICFIREGDYTARVRQDPRALAAGRGPIVHVDGRLLGEHEGYYHYTIGQRRGLGVAFTDKLFVVAIDAQQNRVVVGSREDCLKRSLIVDRMSLVGRDALPMDGDYLCQIRAHHTAEPVRIYPLDHTQIEHGGRARVEFSRPVESPAPGQAAVFYRDDECLGGGTIVETEA